jgi:serine protease Do
MGNRKMAGFAVGVLALTLSGSSAFGQAQAAASQTGVELSSALEATTRLVAPSVVEIVTTSYTPGDGVSPRAADLVATQRGSGSGVIVDPEGFIVTNAHVVRGAQRLRVEVPMPPVGRSILAPRSRTVTGRVVGIDLETDLAVVKIDEQNLPALAFGDSDELAAGQLVLAVGSPLGLHNSVSLGVISAVARQLAPESPMIYVQTDASINPGSSGGPLVDVRGRIVGINTLIATQAGGSEGVGFAAPSNIVKTVYEEIKKIGHVRRGDIGVRAQTVTPVLAAGLGLSNDARVILADVLPGSSAARAGLRGGDVVLSVDGKPMENGRQLQVTLYRRVVGELVSIEALRGGQKLKVHIEVAERLNPFADTSALPDPRENLISRLGILAINLNRQIAEDLPVLRVSSGVVVASIAAGTIDSREGGLAAGDVIYAVNRKRVQQVSELRSVIDALKPGDPVVLQIERRGDLLYVAFTIE